MATTLYGTFPILVPGKTETISRNGLKRTSGTILFKHGQLAQANVIVLGEGEPFPEPQVRKTDMGLLEMAFDAYENTGPSSGVFGTEVLNLSKSFSDQALENFPAPRLVSLNWTVTEVWLADSYTEFKVIGALTGSMLLPVAGRTLNKRLVSRRVTGNRPSGGTSSLTITWASEVSSVTRRNFGVYDEVDIVTSLVATVE